MVKKRILSAALAIAVFFMLVSLGGAAPLEERVNLHPPHIGADSTTFPAEEDCGGVDAYVVWHFVLNQLDAGTDSLTLHATFENAGELQAEGRSVGNGSLQHFYVGTMDDDILTGAYVDAPGQSRTPKLLLSHVCLNGEKEKDNGEDEEINGDLDEENGDEEKKVPGEDPKVDPEDKDKDVPADEVEEKELPQTKGTQFPMMGIGALLAAAGILIKRKK